MSAIHVTATFTEWLDLAVVHVAIHETEQNDDRPPHSRNIHLQVPVSEAGTAAKRTQHYLLLAVKALAAETG